MSDFTPSKTREWSISGEGCVLELFCLQVMILPLSLVKSTIALWELEKSANLRKPSSVTRRFRGLMPLWITPIVWRYWRPFKISLSSSFALSSVIGTFFKKDSRSPYEAYSITILILKFSSSISWYLITLGCYTIWRMFISLLMSLIDLYVWGEAGYFLFNLAVSKIFMA